MIDKAKDFLLENKLEISCVLASSALYHIISLLKRDTTKPLPENESEIVTLSSLSTLSST
jgi:hypothetical protein